jgi:hypothetical protein
MLIIQNQSFDPRISSHETIKHAMEQAVGAKAIHVEWFDFSLNQSDAMTYYMPLVHYAQSLGFEVHCLMPVDMSKHLVRYKHLMFVDPLFLRKFKFKSIQFKLPVERPDLMR